jgi:hypothetical protein
MPISCGSPAIPALNLGVDTYNDGSSYPDPLTDFSLGTRHDKTRRPGRDRLRVSRRL